MTFGAHPFFWPETWRKIPHCRVSSDQFTPVGCFILGIIWLSKIPIEDCNKPLLRIPILHIGIFYWKSPLMFFFGDFCTASTLVHHHCSPRGSQVSLADLFPSVEKKATKQNDWITVDGKNLGLNQLIGMTQKKKNKTWLRSFYEFVEFVGRIFISLFIQNVGNIHPKVGVKHFTPKAWVLHRAWSVLSPKNHHFGLGPGTPPIKPASFCES